MKCKIEFLVNPLKTDAGVIQNNSKVPTACERIGALVARVVVGLGLAIGLCCGSAVAAELPIMSLKEIKFPTGIDYWPAQKKLLFADYEGGIYSIQEDGTRLERMTAIRGGDCSSVTRLRVDGERNRMWILGAGGICVYDLQNLRLIRHLPLTDMSQYQLANGLTDIAMDQRGNAYAIDTGIDPIVYRIDAATFTVSSLNKTRPPGATGVYSPQQLPLNAVAVTPQGGHLLYVNAYTGTLNVIDLGSKAEWTVAMPNSLYAVNGLTAAIGADTTELTLYALSARNDSITAVGITSDLKNARSRVFATKYLDQPHAAAWARNALFVTNSQLLKHPQIIYEDRAEIHQFSIVRLNAGYFADQAANPILDSVLSP